MNKIVKISDEEYFAAEGLNNSFLIAFDRSPAHSQIPIKKTKAMTQGAMLHRFILEPIEFYKEYQVLPENIKNDTRVKVYKEYVKDFPEKIFISKADQLELEEIRKNIYIWIVTGKHLILFIKLYRL